MIVMTVVVTFYTLTVIITLKRKNILTRALIKILWLLMSLGDKNG